MIILVSIVYLLVITGIVWKWVQGFHYMQEHHPDYKGEDFP